MQALQRLLRAGFMHAEALFNRAFGDKLNPLYHLGATIFFLFWIVGERQPTTFHFEVGRSMLSVRCSPSSFLVSPTVSLLPANFPATFPLKVLRAH